MVRHQLHLAEADGHVGLDDVFWIRDRAEAIRDGANLDALEGRIDGREGLQVAERERHREPGECQLAEVSTRIQKSILVADGHAALSWCERAERQSRVLADPQAPRLRILAL
jgi:hypothetical protein